MSPITILEFAPAADEIWGLEHDPHAGYAARDPDAGTLTFHDIPRHDTKMRPLLRGLYAGGKATNVARVLDRLLDAAGGPPPPVSLTTFLARSGPGYDDLTPGAAFVRALQRQEMHRITLAYEPLPPRDGLVADRRCIHLVDERTGTDLLNFSPRLVWSDAEARHVLRTLRRHPPEGLVVLAGSVPLGVPGLYPDVIRTLRTVTPTTRIAADIDVPSLIRCLEAGLAPDYVSMNRREFEQIDPSRWEGFRGILHVHDRSGARAWQAVPPPGPPAARIDIAPLAAALGPATGPTLGAGDAAHAGFLLGLTTGRDLAAALRLGQAVAAATVRYATGTRGFDLALVRRAEAILSA